VVVPFLYLERQGKPLHPERSRLGDMFYFFSPRMDTPRLRLILLFANGGHVERLDISTFVIPYPLRRA